MSETFSIAIFVLTLFLTLGLGIWVGASLLITAGIGMLLFTTRPIGDSFALIIWSSQSSWTLTALPLFIWMGEILYRSKLSEILFKGLAPFMTKLPGGLLHVNIAACTIFAAISGSSAATVATVGKMSIPELKKRKYPDRMIIGSLAGAGTLGLLIPPSISMIIYGVTVNESISKLFIASVIPGMVLALMFTAYVMLWGLFSNKNKKELSNISQSNKQKWLDLFRLIPVIILILAVIVSIYTGLATATEAAAVGVLGSFILSFTYGSLNFKSFKQSSFGAIKTSAMIMFILMGSSVLSLAMGFTGIPKFLAETITGFNLTPVALILTLTIFYIILGCFLDGISSIVLTMAVLEPTLRSYDINMLWFGVYLMIVVEMAQITPPIGFNLFVLKSLSGKSIQFIARASLPMFFIMFLFIMILYFFPSLATFLPEIMK